MTTFVKLLKKNGFSKGSTQLWSPRNKVVYIVCTRAHQESQWLMCQGSKYPGKVAATWYTSHSNKNFISADRNTADYTCLICRECSVCATHISEAFSVSRVLVLLSEQFGRSTLKQHLLACSVSQVSTACLHISDSCFLAPFLALAFCGNRSRTSWKVYSH